MVGGRAKEPCKAMGRDGMETEHDCRDPHRKTSQMVVVVEGEIGTLLGF